MPSTTPPCVGLPELHRPLALATYFLMKIYGLKQRRKRSNLIPLCQSVPPEGTPFFYVSTASIFCFLLCTPFLAYRFANVHRNSFLSGCKGRSLILPRFAQSDYHLNPCIHSSHLFHLMHANPIDKQGTQKVHNQKKGENRMKPYTYEKLKRSPPEKASES